MCSSDLHPTPAGRVRVGSKTDPARPVDSPRCVYLDVFIFYGMYMLGRDVMFLFIFLVSHVLHWLLIYIMRFFMIYVFYFLFCEIKNLVCFYLYFPHVSLCVC